MELLASITILGIIITAAVVTYNKFLENSKKKYYKSQEDLATLAGKQYFTDYRSKLPSAVGDKESVDLSTLYSLKYLDEIKDYSGKTCSPAKDADSNKVYAYKVLNGDYKYYTIIECNGYKTAKDKKRPVITFSPKKSVSNKNIDIVMKITDNMNVDIYSYEVIKDGTVIKTEKDKKYSGPITITLIEEGSYIIKGHAKDDWGNTTDKISEKYIIDKTAPDCSKIEIASTNNSIKEKWQNKDVKLRITPHSDIAKWNFSNCFKLASDFNSEYCKNDGKGLKGSISKTLRGNPNGIITEDNQKDNGHVFGRITAYDAAGNFCSVDTGEYYIDKDAPIIDNIEVDSSEDDYNSLKVNIKLELSDRVDKTNNHIYYSISNDGTNYSSLYEYPISEEETVREWNLSGSYDGTDRTIYIKIKDEVGNQTAIYQTTYKVYKECDSTFTTRSEGACSGSCGSQKKQITTTYKDSYTNKSCKTDTSSASCVTSNCKTPSCSISLSGGTKGDNGWYRGGTVTYTLNTTNATAYGIGGYNSKKTGTINSDGTRTITGYVKNSAGKTATCSTTIYYDKTAPTCIWNKENTKWTKNNYYTYKGCRDNGSGCVKNIIASETVKTSKIVKRWGTFTIKDKAGNTRNCPKKNLDIYVDKDYPTFVKHTYHNYRGYSCIDRPTTLYEYRYEVILYDATSRLKYTNCSSSRGNISVERKNLTGGPSVSGVIENFCIHQSATITCKACDYAGYCKTFKNK